MEYVVGGKSIEADDHGYLVNQDDWSREVAEVIAKEEGVTLNQRGWDIIEHLREEAERRELELKHADAERAVAVLEASAPSPRLAAEVAAGTREVFVMTLPNGVPTRPIAQSTRPPRCERQRAEPLDSLRVLPGAGARCAGRVTRRSCSARAARHSRRRGTPSGDRRRWR